MARRTHRANNQDIQDNTPTTDEPTPQPFTPTKTRRRPMLIAAGIALVILGGLGASWWSNVQSNSVSVLVLKEPVQRGDTIDQQDLTEMEIIGGQANNAINAENTNEILGKVAAVDLPKGAMLTDTAIAQNTTVPEGESLVGLSLEAAQIPATELRPGDHIRIVATPLQQGDIPNEAPQTIDATIYAVAADAKTGEQLITVTVPNKTAPDVAAWAATDRIALVVDPAPAKEQ